MSREVIRIGTEGGFRVEVASDPWEADQWSITFWRHNHGSGLPYSVTGKEKALALGEYLYETLLPEFGATERRQKLDSKRHLAELRSRPKPKPPKIPKKAPILDVVVCGECSRLILPDNVSDERVYECSRCNQVFTGDDARRCEQCNIFTAKISDTSCPECGAAMDDAERGHAQRATNGELVRYFSPEELAAQAEEQAKQKAAAEAAEAERERARDEKHRRLKELWGRGIAPCVGTVCDDAINFDFAGCRYEIREID